jgi:predicted nuclease with RNAse H fold
MEPVQAARWAQLTGGRRSAAVGVDLAGSEQRPTGWALLRGPAAEVRTLRTDAEIVAATLGAGARVVSIDSPLSVPAEGIIRESERQLMALRIGVYPCLLPSMRALTERGMRLKERFEAEGLRVIEGFPGAAQDVLGIARKKTSVAGLRAGLEGLGLALPDGRLTHHELDAMTAALIGQCYLAGRYHAIGAPGEAPVIVPVGGTGRVRVRAADAATQQFCENYLALFRGLRPGGRAAAIEVPALRTRAQLRQWLARLAT